MSEAATAGTATGRPVLTDANAMKRFERSGAGDGIRTHDYDEVGSMFWKRRKRSEDIEDVLKTMAKCIRARALPVTYRATILDFQTPDSLEPPSKIFQEFIERVSLLSLNVLLIGGNKLSGLGTTPVGAL